MGHEAKIVSPHYAQLIPAVINEFKPELIICSRTPQLLNAMIMAQSKQITVYCWNTDARGDIKTYQQCFGPELIDLFKICDRLYTVGLGEVEMLKTEGINAFHLPQGIYPMVDNMPLNVFSDRYLHDVSFLGTIDQFHEELCQRTSILREIYKIADINTDPAYGKDASEIYCRTKINIGISAFPDLEHCISVRDYKIMGSGGFLLTNYQKDKEKHFEVGKELVCFKTPEEAREKVEYYLEHEDERIKIAEYGYAKAHREYKYEDRLKEMLNG